MIQHIEYGMGFIVDAKFMNSPGLMRDIKNAIKCNDHAMHYILNNHSYRKYRRGSNRCLRCGVKVK